MLQKLKSYVWVGIWLVGILSLGVSLTAQSPVLAPHSNDGAEQAETASAAEPEAQQVHIKAVIYDVDPAKLVALVGDDVASPGELFLKQNGFCPLSPDEDLSEGQCAVSDTPVSLEIEGHDLRQAFRPISRPVIRTLMGQRASIQVGMEASLPHTSPAPNLPKSEEEANDEEKNEVEEQSEEGARPDTLNAFEDSLTVTAQQRIFKLELTPTLTEENSLSLKLRLEDSAVVQESDKDKLVDGEETQPKVLKLSHDVKSGQHLFIAIGTGRGNLMRFIQLSPQVISSAEIAALPAKRPSASRPTVVEPRGDALSEENDLNRPDTSAGSTLPATPNSPLTQDSPLAQDSPPATKPENAGSAPTTPGPDARMSNAAVVQVRVYEIDHQELTKSGGKIKVAFDELLQPAKAYGHDIQVANGPGVKAWTAKNGVVPAMFGNHLGSIIRVVSEPKLTIVEGKAQRFDYGGAIPHLIVMWKSGAHSTSTSGSNQPLATEFFIEATSFENQRVRLSAAFDPLETTLKADAKPAANATKPLQEYRIRAVTELAAGQTLCFSDFNPNSPSGTESLLVTITPEQLKQVVAPAEPTPAPVVKSSPPPNREFTVEERWPISELKVGQRVFVVPVSLSKTSLSTSYGLMALTAEASFSLRVSRIEPLAAPQNAGPETRSAKGRRVTLIVDGVKAEELEGVEWKAILELVEAATTNCVIPIEQLSISDFGWIDEIYWAIDPAVRPSPVEISLGDHFIATGVQGVFPKPDAPAQMLGGLTLEYLDDDNGGIWKASGSRTGMTRLIQLQPHHDGLQVGQLRRTEYRIKADTRELELHLMQQFPDAKVTVTSIGASALMLSGAVKSDAESEQIKALAEQFTANVINRLKAPSGMNQASNGTTLSRPAILDDTPSLTASPLETSSEERSTGTVDLRTPKSFPVQEEDFESPHEQSGTHSLQFHGVNDELVDKSGPSGERTVPPKPLISARIQQKSKPGVGRNGDSARSNETMLLSERPELKKLKVTFRDGPVDIQQLSGALAKGSKSETGDFTERSANVPPRSVEQSPNVTFPVKPVSATVELDVTSSSLQQVLDQLLRHPNVNVVVIVRPLDAHQGQKEERLNPVTPEKNTDQSEKALNADD